MKAKSAKAKGCRFESFIAEQIRESGIDPKARRQMMSGAGFDKGDIASSIPFTIEVKNQKVMHLLEWIEQAKSQAQKSNTDSDKWVLMIRNPSKPEFQEVFVVMDFGQWLELLKSTKDTVEIEVESDNRELKWAVQNLKVAVNKVIKELE